MQVKHLQFRANGRNRITARLGAPLMFGFGADGQGMLPWLAQNLSALLTILVSILLLAALAVLLFGIVREIRRNAVFLDPIDVPRALDTRGYSPAVVAERLLDALSAMQRKAPTLKELLGIESPPALVDLEVPARFSLQAIVRFIQRLVRIPESHIGGEITCEGEAYELTLRRRDQNSVSIVGDPSLRTWPPSVNNSDSLRARGLVRDTKAVRRKFATLPMASEALCCRSMVPSPSKSTP